MKGTGNSEKGRFWLTLTLVMALIVIAVTISTTIGAVNVSASDIGKILVNKMSGKDIFQIAWEGKTENIIWNIRFPRVLMDYRRRRSVTVRCTHAGPHQKSTG